MASHSSPDMVKRVLELPTSTVMGSGPSLSPRELAAPEEAPEEECQKSEADSQLMHAALHLAPACLTDSSCG